MTFVEKTFLRYIVVLRNISMTNAGVLPFDRLFHVTLTNDTKKQGFILFYSEFTNVI